MSVKCNCCSNKLHFEENRDGTVTVTVVRVADDMLTALVEAVRKHDCRLESAVTLTRTELLEMIGEN